MKATGYKRIAAAHRCSRRDPAPRSVWAEHIWSKANMGFWLAAGLMASVQAATVIPGNSVWQYRKGTNEASTPIDAWRGRSFNAAAWSQASAPFHFGESSIVTGTKLADMQGVYNGVFLRRAFTVTNAAEVSSMTLYGACDDGFVAWINGVEIARYRLDAGTISYTTLANSSAPEPVTFIAFAATNYATSLVSGTNILAVQAFNRLRDNGDFQIDARLEITWRDPTPPTLVRVEPTPGSVPALDHITVTFSEPVVGVDETDLLVNGVPTRDVGGSGTTYTFQLDRLLPGAVRIGWAANHGIVDLGVPPNPFDGAAPGAIWDYKLFDGTPPTLAAVHPPAGVTLSNLCQVELTFSETVVGLDAADLRLNGTPARRVSGIGAGPFEFEFDPAPQGPAVLVWALGHTITDRASPPNAFVGAPWSYTVHSNLAPPAVVLNELCAANLTGLQDEDGDAQDWIEIFNAGATRAALEGWSLTDDADHPGKWVFPNVSIEPGRFLVVFASGKDRREPTGGAPLHTNFKLADDGEYLALLNMESPRCPVDVFEPGFPEQRTGIAFGRVAGGGWRYFATPTPGATNSGTTVTGTVSRVRFEPGRGFRFAPVAVTLTQDTPGAAIRYTTDGSEPSATNGTLYAGPITVAATTVLRAAAFKADCLPSRVATHTYLFPDLVPAQPANPPGFPATWGSSKVTPGDYAMDPRVATNATLVPSLRAGLTNLPSLSLVMPVADWFSPARGIYSNGQNEGMAWERSASAELLRPDGRDAFQVGCGLRIQGGTSPEPWKSYKLSLRLNFRSDYGTSRLEYRLFPDTPVARFDTLVLDAGLNYFWHYGGGVSPEEQRTRAKYVHDQFTSDLQSLTGTPCFHGRFVNLYLNGLYWGVYNLHEEPEAAFAADYYGGDEAEYDVIKHTGSNVLDGNHAAWEGLMARARAGLTVTSNYVAISKILDLESLCDYMIVHCYVGNTDWPQHNWYALRRRVPEALWRFVSWDSEHILKTIDANVTGVSTADSPAEIYSLLRLNAEFRLLFADRVHRHFFNGGILYVDPAAPGWDPNRPDRNRPAALYQSRVAEVFDALVAESARWGDNQRPAQPYTRDAEFMTELNWLRAQYFPQRSAVVLNQFRALGLYPSLAAPTLNQPGGYVARGFQLAFTVPAGTVYYTRDGSDPRVPFTGALAATAVPYIPGSPVTLDATTLVKARTLSGSSWSALTEATFQVADLGLPLRPTEIMYHPPGGEAYEFLELRNTGPVPIDVSGLRIDGLGFAFPPFTVVAPGQVLVLASDRNPAAFALRYPGVTVFATFSGALDNGGEALALKYPDGRSLWRLEYDDSGAWPPEADGAGYSLECIDPDRAPSDPANWRRSVLPGGSPGVVNPAVTPHTIRLNEIHAAAATADPIATVDPDRVPPSDANSSDWIEIFNAGPQPVSLAGWGLGDAGNPRRFVFPGDVRVAAEGFLLVWCDRRPQPVGLHTGFGLAREGECLVLGDSQSNRVDALTFGNQIPGYTLGRGQDGQWLLTDPTPLAVNSPAVVADPTNLVLNEWLANPVPGERDWLEIHNRSTQLPVAVEGLYLEADGVLDQVLYPMFVAPGGYYRFWADDQAETDHLTFVLPAGGGTLVLRDLVGKPLDQVSYPSQVEDVPFGRFPDGSANVGPLVAHTPDRPNSNNPDDSDRDADGLGDAWEEAMGLDRTRGDGLDGAEGDPDGDGLPNAAELVAGTHPRSAGSRLEFAEVRFGADGLHLKFQACPGRFYRVEYGQALTASGWTLLEETPMANGPAMTEVVDRQPLTAGSRFYRLWVGRR
jgi:hypothetical protein